MFREGSREIFIIVLALPLIIALFFLLRAFILNLHEFHTLGAANVHFKKLKNQLYCLSAAIIFLVILFIALLVFPTIVLFLMFMVFLISLYALFAGLFGFFQGLGRVTGAGGSSAEVLRSLTSYLREYFSIKQPEESSQNDLLTTSHTDAPTKPGDHQP